MANFSIDFNTNKLGFGPNTNDTHTLESCLAKLGSSPFEPNLKIAPLGKICDFTYASKQRLQRDLNRWGIVQKAEDDLNFQPVETRTSNKLTRQAYTSNSNRNNSQNKQKLKESTEAFMQKQQQELSMFLSKKKQSEIKKYQAAQKAKQMLKMARQKNYSVWSIDPSPEWRNVCEIELNKLISKTIDLSKLKVRDITWKGILNYYNKQADRTSPRLPIQLTDAISKYKFYWPTTTEDEIIQDILEDEDMNVQVAATSQILAVLMSSPPSRYSWHLEIIKVEGKIIIEKAHHTLVDLVTVNETSVDPPSQESDNKINRPWNLGIEAWKINQNFSQHVLDFNEPPAKVFEPPTFVDPDDKIESAHMAYRYRVFTLPIKNNSRFGSSPINIVTRADVHCALKTPDGGESLTALYAVNEFDKKKNWSKQIENQKGALLATEIGHNICRLQKYVLAATLGGCDTIKLGFATRQSPNEAEKHSLLMIQSLKTEDFGKQIGLNMSNAWGIIEYLLELIMGEPDGKYIIVKDPTKSILRIYEIKDEDGGVVTHEKDDLEDDLNTHTQNVKEEEEGEGGNVINGSS